MIVLPLRQLRAIENKMPMREEGKLHDDWRKLCEMVHRSLDSTIATFVSNSLREDLTTSIPTEMEFMNSLEGRRHVFFAHPSLIYFPWEL